MHSYRGHMVQVPTGPGQALPAVVTQLIADDVQGDTYAYSVVNLHVFPDGSTNDPSYGLAGVKLYDVEGPARGEPAGTGAWTLDG